MRTPPIIQTLWVGSKLSSMERLSIESFLRNGHAVHLYVYQDVSGIPEGVVLCDGNQILPESRIFLSREHATYAQFASFFRYKLLLERGGWYVDCDMVCLRPFDFQRDYVFASQGIHTPRMVNNNVIKAPAGSEIMRRAWEACDAMETSNLRWGVPGPELMTRLTAECSLQQFVEPPEIFCPLDWSDWEREIEAGSDLSFGESVYGIHLWRQKWRQAARDPDAAYPVDCLYERLKRRYGVAAGAPSVLSSPPFYH
jgi:mannosyltransferase OCH1-like enzyme